VVPSPEQDSIPLPILLGRDDGVKFLSMQAVNHDLALVLKWYLACLLSYPILPHLCGPVAEVAPVCSHAVCAAVGFLLWQVIKGRYNSIFNGFKTSALCIAAVGSYALELIYNWGDTLSVLRYYDRAHYSKVKSTYRLLVTCQAARDQRNLPYMP
jgi:hypothetical protein